MKTSHKQTKQCANVIAHYHITCVRCVDLLYTRDVVVTGSVNQHIGVNPIILPFVKYIYNTIPEIMTANFLSSQVVIT